MYIYCSLDEEGTGRDGGGIVWIRISGATFSELSSITVKIDNGIIER
jgi:hypothetical protein